MLRSGRQMRAVVGRRGMATAYELPTRTTTLPSKMRVASETTPGETATVGVWIDSGTRFEDDRTAGTAHFLEHMAFKGTGKRTKEQLELQVENMGAHLNAYTSREQTVYYAKVFKDNVPEAVDILADILTNSTLDLAAIDRERGVILREEEEIAKSEEETIFDRLHATAYQGTPLERVILGTRDNILNITQEDLKTYIKTHYTAPRCVLVGAGAVDHEQLCALGEKAFGQLPTERSGAVQAELQASPSIFTGSDVRNREDDMEHAHVAFAFEGPGWTSSDSVPMMVMQMYLGSWEQSSVLGSDVMSRMCARVSEIPATQTVTTFNTVYSDTSLFGVYYVAEPEGVEDVQWALQYEFTRACWHIEEDQLERAKTALKTNLVLGLDDTSQAAEDIGRQMLVYNRRLPLSEMFARIDSVDAAELKRVGQMYLYDREMAVTAMGPVKGLPDYNWIRRRNYWLRY